jgi:hypothetical protein
MGAEKLAANARLTTRRRRTPVARARRYGVRGYCPMRCVLVTLSPSTP